MTCIYCAQRSAEFEKLPEKLLRGGLQTRLHMCIVVYITKGGREAEMSTYVRIQDRKYGTEGLFDADRLSWDMGMCDDNARAGVSCCDDLEALLDYYVQAPIEIGDDPVIITMEGVESDDEPLDAELGERLIHPTRIISIVSADAAGFFDGINARLDD